MKNNSPKHIAFKTLVKHQCYLLNNYTDLQRIIEFNQFTIIEYKKHTNSEPVSELIKRLRVENEIEQKDSFLYVNNNIKLLFIYADASPDDKCALLRHELGHICDPDFRNDDAGYSKIKREEFANEFSFYIKNPGIRFKFKILIMKKWKLLVSMMVLMTFVLGLSFMIDHLFIKPQKTAISDTPPPQIPDNIYYVTSSGKKYHRKHCIIVKYKNNLTEMTLNETVNSGYKPCLICTPQ